LHRPRWLVIGPGIDESAVLVLVATAWQTYPDLKLAMLGPLGDLRRCERWLRRGCHVLLDELGARNWIQAVRRACDLGLI
jgi:hypothetical protein